MGPPVSTQSGSCLRCSNDAQVGQPRGRKRDMGPGEARNARTTVPRTSVAGNARWWTGGDRCAML